MIRKIGTRKSSTWRSLEKTWLSVCLLGHSISPGSSGSHVLQPAQSLELAGKTWKSHTMSTVVKNSWVEVMKFFLPNDMAEKSCLAVLTENWKPRVNRGNWALKKIESNLRTVLRILFLVWCSSLFAEVPRVIIITFSVVIAARTFFCAQLFVFVQRSVPRGLFPVMIFHVCHIAIGYARAGSASLNFEKVRCSSCQVLDNDNFASSALNLCTYVSRAAIRRWRGANQVEAYIVFSGVIFWGAPHTL